MRVVLKFREGKWEVRVIEPSCGGLGIILLGPRAKFYYLPPIPSDSKYHVPKYLLERITGLNQFPELEVGE